MSVPGQAGGDDPAMMFDVDKSGKTRLHRLQVGTTNVMSITRMTDFGCF